MPFTLQAARHGAFGLARCGETLRAPLRRLRDYVAARLHPAGPGLGPWGFTGHPDQAFGPVTYAQFGEDLILANIFASLGIAKPRFLDIGAHHPINCSNTALLYAMGARGICVEANPNLIPPFRALRPQDQILNIGCGVRPDTLDFYMIDHASGRNTFDRATAEAFIAAYPAFRIREVRQIPVLALDDIVERYCAGQWPDFLSLDIEGLDYDVLKASRLHHLNGPKVICAEAISGADSDKGADIETLLAERGYEILGRTIANVIFGAKTLP